ncbi:MAG: hypothetical protein HQM05_17865 [Magnetococcales bacterium]|nr:hypothetical protein [Magnetococcales bacterium]
MNIVNNQLHGASSPEVKKTYHRLCRQGYNDEETRKLIASVLESEAALVLKHHEPFDQTRYVAKLRYLPRVLA